MIKITPPTPETPPTETIVARIRANAVSHPDHLALVCGEDHLTWGAFDLRINRVANLLIEMELGKDDNVAIISANSIAYA
ncbi:MAG: long-chain acyl-CoA synthetase, partial [Candidatus Azotimanducaceae bacterium]